MVNHGHTDSRCQSLSHICDGVRVTRLLRAQMLPMSLYCSILLSHLGFLWILYWRGFSCVTIYFSNHFSSLLNTKRKEKTSKPTNCQYLTVTKSHKTYKLSTSDSYKTTQNLPTVNIWQLQNHTKPINCQHLTVTKSHKTYKLSTSDSYKITQNLQTVNIWQLQNHTKPTNS
jgi:hypothetical protein